MPRIKPSSVKKLKLKRRRVVMERREDEDVVLSEMARLRDHENVTIVSHEDAWK